MEHELDRSKFSSGTRSSNVLNESAKHSNIYAGREGWLLWRKITQSFWLNSRSKDTALKICEASSMGINEAT